MGGIGGPELLLVLIVVLLIFGPAKIPEVARGIGKGLRELRRLNTEFQRELNLADPSRDEPPVDRGGTTAGPKDGGESGPGRE